jgi:hypothetical protein
MVRHHGTVRQGGHESRICRREELWARYIAWRLRCHVSRWHCGHSGRAPLCLGCLSALGAGVVIPWPIESLDGDEGGYR